MSLHRFLVCFVSVLVLVSRGVSHFCCDLLLKQQNIDNCAGIYFCGSRTIGKKRQTALKHPISGVGTLGGRGLSRALISLSYYTPLYMSLIFSPFLAFGRQFSRNRAARVPLAPRVRCRGSIDQILYFNLVE